MGNVVTNIEWETSENDKEIQKYLQEKRDEYGFTEPFQTTSVTGNIHNPLFGIEVAGFSIMFNGGVEAVKKRMKIFVLEVKDEIAQKFNAVIKSHTVFLLV